LGKNEEKVIRPPVKQITSGKTFKPSQAYLHKMLAQSVVTFILIWLSVAASLISTAYMVALDPSSPSATQIINDYFVPVNLWTVIINLFWLVPALLLTPP
jgi:hypothetical protein